MRKLVDRLVLLKIQKSQPGVPLEGIVTTGVEAEVPPPRNPKAFKGNNKK